MDKIKSYLETKELEKQNKYLLELRKFDANKEHNLLVKNANLTEENKELKEENHELIDKKHELRDTFLDYQKSLEIVSKERDKLKEIVEKIKEWKRDEEQFLSDNTKYDSTPFLNYRDHAEMVIDKLKELLGSKAES